ncbi:efflux RND transporter periplasmic adaptor subunit [uncultured Phascolarctobacterium sp.]|uniref:efflux RND transporter periplasmic adaptor subunit n=2 Tax=uncultured Phascolarctobacterium sp. TaxID=512296 RepID=UPI00265C8DB7|nr:efflux RND transporter periplasmic adaptor subunit [uncultured Phascolarctobacterium sp.]
MMNKKFFIIIAAVLAVISGLWFFLQPDKQDHARITLYGNVDIRQFDIGFQVPGQITKMYFEEGDTIKEGSLVAEIDAADYKLQEAQAESEVAKAYASMIQSRSVYDKYTVLYSTGAISKLDFETAENTLKETQAVYNAALTAKDLLVRQSDYSRLYALEDGIVTARLVEPGAIVQKGTAVYTLSKPRPIWIRAYVSEVNLGNIYDGMPAEIITDSIDPQTGTKRTYQGHIGYISPVSEFTPKSVQTTDLRTDLVYMIRVYADNPDKFLRQGMPTTVTLDLKSNRGK